ncbi:hypothetical protein DSECCO2_664100 [anaerobic digester metagenome]
MGDVLGMAAALRHGPGGGGGSAARTGGSHGAGVAGGAGHFCFQRLHLGHHVDVHAVPRLGRVHPVGLAVLWLGQQVGVLVGQRLAPFVHGQHAEAVQPQEQQVHQVFLRKQVRPQVGVQQTQAAQAARARAGAGQLRNGDGPGVAHQHHGHAALPVDEHGHLPPHAAGQGGQFAGLLVRIAPHGGEAALVQTGQGLDVAGLEPLGVAENLGDGSAPALAE